MRIDKKFHKEAELARTLLVLSNYEWIKAEATAVGVEIIPLKGIDLLQTLYAERLDRHVSDIDILCRSEDDCRVLVNRLCQEEYRVEFPFAMRHEALAVKRKVSLLSCSTTKVNVDIHISFVTKKFFSQTIGSFNADALMRCKDGHMDDTDRWLFLAQHAAFHAFADIKWTEDLRLLYDGFTARQKAELLTKASTNGFRRVLIAALHRVRESSPCVPPENEAHACLSSSERRFLSFIGHYNRPFCRNITDRVVSVYWEFIFIARRKDRMKAWFRLIFPSRGMLTNIYRIKQPSAQMLFYPLNILITLLTSCLFWTIYIIISLKKHGQHHHISC